MRPEAGILAPVLYVTVQGLVDLGKWRAAYRTLDAEQLGCRRITQADFACLVNNDNAFAQVLNNVLVELRQVAQVDTTLQRQCFTRLDTPP